MRIHWRDWLGAAVVALPLLAAACLFRGIEKYPTNDDWVFARSTKTLVETGHWRWTAHNGQLFPSTGTLIIAGAAASADGFSFNRIVDASLLLSLAGVVGVYALGRRSGARVSLALLAAWSFAACPWYFGHAFTFMTDSPAVGLSLAAASLLIAAATSHQRAAILGGILILTAAVLTRQTALSLILLPLALRRATPSRGMTAAVIIPVVVLAVFEISVRGFSSVHRTSAIEPRALKESLNQVARAAYEMLLVVGFSLVPLAALLWNTISWRRRTVIVASLALLPGVFFIGSGGRGVLTSATGPSLANAHFGPVLLSDCDESGRWGDIGGVQWPLTVWFIATLLSFASLAVIAAASENTLSNWLRNPEDPLTAAAMGLLAAGVGAAIVLLATMGFSFDRYWLATVGPLIGWAVVRIGANSSATAPRIGIAWAILSLAALFALDVAFTHDWLSFNQARWKLVEQLQRDGFSPEQIDGGYEVNGWHRSAEDPLTRPRPGAESARWWSERAARFLAVGPRPGMEEVGRATWISWAAGAGRQVPVLVLKRSEPAPLPPFRRPAAAPSSR